jgi:hypothetical protein
VTAQIRISPSDPKIDLDRPRALTNDAGASRAAIALLPRARAVHRRVGGRLHTFLNLFHQRPVRAPTNARDDIACDARWSASSPSDKCAACPTQCPDDRRPHLIGQLEQPQEVGTDAIPDRRRDVLLPGETRRQPTYASASSIGLRLALNVP